MSDSKKKKVNFIFRIVMFFTLGCFIGCLLETILCYIQLGFFESRKGLIYGPFNPVYGIGVILVIFFLEREKKRYLIFLAGAFLGGLVEYICSWVQESTFGTISWDYHKYFLNFDGRTSLFYMFWWGVLSYIFIKAIYPIFLKFIYLIKEKYRLTVSITLIVFFSLDILISGYACIRQKQRIDHIEATTIIQKFFDNNFPNERMNKLFPNRKIAKTNVKINKVIEN
jgi:uncharacterized membrane protein